MKTQSSFTNTPNSGVNLGNTKNLREFLDTHKYSTIKEYTIMSLSLGYPNVMIKVDAGFTCIDSLHPGTFILDDEGFTKII
jgi:hypothetical protein